MSVTDFGWLILGFPLAGMLVISLGWRKLPGRSPGWIASGAILGAFLSSIGALIKLEELPAQARNLASGEVTASAFTYAKTFGVDVNLGILLDPLAIFMCLVVSGVSFLIHVYSVSYMTSDRGFARYFAYLNFFVFSMLLLVLADNFILLIVGWAFVGAASYMLISFYYRRKTATAAGIKAFVMNVIGDVGLVVGAFLLFSKTGALDYAGVFDKTTSVFSTNEGTLVAACLLILVGAFAKSAQLPLHTWLPDAMEGPTPVSALIHAATMVTAGVYLIARTYPLFEQAPAAADVSAIIGTATLFFAATVALAVTDLKRVIAYSTMSQIGYMVLGVSVFAYGSGLFQLMTHAFFKALLFMGAGSVIGAMGGEQSLDKMGGLRRAMPFTFVVFTIGALALAAFPLTSGFFSKDSILAFTINRGGWYVVLGVVGYLAAAMTAFYAFRMVFRVFFGKPVPEAESLERGEQMHHEPANPATGEPEDSDVGFPGPTHQFAEREWPMKFAMAPLALLALGAGAVGIPGVTDVIGSFLEPTFEGSAFAGVRPSVGDEWAGLAVGGTIAVLSILAAAFVFLRRPEMRVEIRERFSAVHAFLAGRWYFDELYDVTIVRPLMAAGRFGRTVIETTLVQGVLVGGTTGAVRAGSSLARAIQSGYVRAYALLLVLGLSGIALYFLLVSN